MERRDDGKGRQISQRIRAIMQKQGLTQNDLSRLLGISQPAVSLYLKGRMPPADVLVRIAQLGNTTVEQLLTGKEAPAESRRLREKAPLYGNRQHLLNLWDQLPSPVQRDVLALLRHLVEWNRRNK